MSEINWDKATNARAILRGRADNKPVPKIKIDEAVSKVVGKPVAVNDPRLIKAVLHMKEYNTSETKFDNFLQNPKAIDHLKKELNK